MVELDRASDSHLDPRVNVRQCPSQLILKYKSDVEAKKRGWEEVKWDHLPLESGPGGGAASTVLKIKNPRPGWKSLLEGQLWNKYNSNVHIHGVDGYVPCHHILFTNVSKMLEDIILDRVSSGSPPSSTKVLKIHLQDTKVCHIREVLKVLAKGRIVIDPLEEEGIRQVMKMLGIDKVVFEKLPVDGRTSLQVASRDVLDISDDGGEVDVEVVEEVKCGMCAFMFNSEIQLEVHLKEECVENFMEFCQLQNRFCFGCAGRFPKYNAEEFIKHVDICVKTNCERAQEYDDEEEEVENEQAETESEFGSNSVKVCFLKECKVRCVKLTDTAVNKIQNLIRCKKHVPLRRLQSYQYVFEVDDAVMEARDESTAMHLSKSVEARRRKPCPLSKRKLQNKVSSHPGQDVSPQPMLIDVLPPPPLIDVSTTETSPPEMPRSSPIDNTTLSTASETPPATEVLQTLAEQSTLTKTRKRGPKSRTMPVLTSEPPPDIEGQSPPPPLIDVPTTETLPPEIPRSSAINNTSLYTVSETPPPAAELLPTPPEQSTLTKTRKRGPKSRTMPVLTSEPPPDIEGQSPPPPFIDVPTTETLPPEIPRSSAINNTSLYTVSETPPPAAELLPTPPEQSTLTKTRKRGPKSRTMPVLTSEPPPDIEGQSPPPPLIDVPTTETPPPEIPRSSPIDNTTLSTASETPPAAEVLITSAEQSTLTKKRKSGPKSITIPVVTSEPPPDFEEPPPPLIDVPTTETPPPEIPRSSAIDSTTLYTVSETPPPAAEVLQTLAEQSTLTKTRKPGPKSRTMPVLTSEPPPDFEEPPPILTDVLTTETPPPEISRTSPTDNTTLSTVSETLPAAAEVLTTSANQSNTTPTKTRKPGPKSRTMPVVTPELTVDMEEPSPPFSPIHSSRLSVSQIPTQTPIPVPEQVTASVQTLQTAESTSIQTSRNVNEHNEATNEAETLVIVREEAQTETLFNENVAVNNVQLSANEVVTTTQNSTSSCSSASLCRAPTPVSPVYTGCNDTGLPIANPPAEVTQTVSSQCVDVRISTPPHSIPSTPTLRPSILIGPRSVTCDPFVSRTPIQSPRIPPPRLTPGPTARQAASSMPQRSSSPFNGVRQHQFTSNNFRVLQTAIHPPPNSQSTQSPVSINNPTVGAPTRMQQQRVVSPVVATFPYVVTSSGSAPTQPQAALSQLQQIEYQPRVNPNQTRIQQLINSARGRMVTPTPPQPRLFNQQRPGGQIRNNRHATQHPVARQVARVCRPSIQCPRQQRLATPAATIGAPTRNTQPATENAWDYISTIPMRNNFCNQVSTPTPPPHYPPASTSSSSSLNFDSLFDAPGATLSPPLNHTSFSLSCMSNERRTSQPSERVHITCPECKLSFGSYESLNDHYENGGCS